MTHVTQELPFSTVSGLGQLFCAIKRLLILRFNLQQHLYPGQYLGTVEWFGDKIFGPGLDPLDAVCLIVFQRGNHHDRDVSVEGVGLDLAAHSKTIHSRHTDIQKTDVDPPRPDLLQCLQAIRRNYDIIPTREQHSLQQAEIERFIIRAEDSRHIAVHTCTSLSSGMVKLNLLPVPNSLFTQTLPPCNSTS